MENVKENTGKLTDKLYEFNVLNHKIYSIVSEIAFKLNMLDLNNKISFDNVAKKENISKLSFYENLEDEINNLYEIESNLKDLYAKISELI